MHGKRRRGGGGGDIGSEMVSVHDGDVHNLQTRMPAFAVDVIMVTTGMTPER